VFVKVVVDENGMLMVPGRGPPGGGFRSPWPVDGVASPRAGSDPVAETAPGGGLMYTARGSSVMRGGPFTKRSGCAWNAASLTS
jgi:hypothetical protein